MSGIEAAFFGSLSRDAELKTSKAGKRYLRLNVRVGDGEDVQWLGVMAFDEKAIEAAEKLTKSARVYIEGRISIDEWTGQDGAKRSGLSCLSWHCRLAQIGRSKPKPERKQEGGDNSSAPRSVSSGAPFDDEVPFAPEWRA
jgi:single-strand DNA-binding protein